MKPTFRTLKIDDVSALQALVVEHLESLEAGLKLLDERALLGGGAIDLVALDGEGRLVLIALALVADDAMLLRMLDAFAWCLESTDTVGRLYTVSPAALAVAPRVFFVSERLSDSFLRKIKHLRMPSIRCLEFCYIEVNGVAGLYFNPVETPAMVPTIPAPASTAARAPAPAPAVSRPPAASPPAAPVVSVAIEPEIVESPMAPSPVVDDLRPMPEAVEPVATVPEVIEPVATVPEVVEPVAAPIEPVDPAPVPAVTIRSSKPSAAAAPRATGGLPADLLKGLRMPENMSSQWRRILSRAVDAPDPAKIRVVREYLQSEFPGAVVYDFYEHQRAAQMFQVQNGQGAVMHLATVSDDFFDANAEGNIRSVLERQRLGRALRDAGPTGVLISAAGLRVAKS